MSQTSTLIYLRESNHCPEFDQYAWSLALEATKVPNATSKHTPHNQLDHTKANMLKLTHIVNPYPPTDKISYYPI